MEHIWTMLMYKILQNHLLCAFVANLKIGAIYALYPESFCEKDLAIRKVFAFCESAINWWHSFLIPFKWMNLATLPICRITTGERVPLDCSFSFCRIWSWWLCCHPGLVTLFVHLSFSLTGFIDCPWFSCRVWFHRCVVTLFVLVQFSLCMILFLYCPMFFMCWKIDQIFKKLSRLWVLSFVGIVSAYVEAA